MSVQNKTGTQYKQGIRITLKGGPKSNLWAEVIASV